MTVQYEQVTVEAEGVSLAGIIWRRFRRPMPGLLEEALAANRGLAALGEYIPVGTTICLPIPAQAEREPDARLTRLWD